MGYIPYIAVIPPGKGVYAESFEQAEDREKCRDSDNKVDEVSQLFSPFIGENS